MLVTGIRETSHERYTVSLSDGSEVRTTLSALASSRIATGRELDEEQLAEFRHLSARSLTLERSIEIISYRPCSCKELKDKLLAKGIPEDIAEYCPQRLTEMGLMDDARYASSVARHYASRGYGAGRIRSEFYRRGIPRDLWEKVLEELPEPDGETDRFLRKKITDPSDPAQIRKATAALFRRGFSWEQIRDALRRLELELEEEGEIE